jgi:hypothetical protein
LSNLERGTRAENDADKIRHGTMMRGEKHVRSRHTDAEVEEAVAMVKGGMTREAVAKLYAVTAEAVGYWVSGKRRGGYSKVLFD